MKCFLSHSSRDKKLYARVVAESLAPNVEYDEVTFEAGMGNLEEILNALDRSSVFVLLISDNSLDSTWVRREVTEAAVRLEEGKLKRFFPIIIDPNIDHTDRRIPDWIRDSYNLRPITRPTIAAKRIRERLVELSWKNHPMLKARDQIFVGRNRQIADFEQRFDDFTKVQPTVVFASGLHEIGRKTTIKYALRKTNFVRDTYEPIRIDLNRDDNIEGFILKLYDLGISEGRDVDNLMKRSVSEKVSLCASLIIDIATHHEVLLLNDEYCIVRFGGDLAPWFEDVILKLGSDRLTLCVATSARPKKHAYIRNDRYFFMHVPELEKVERVGLFKRYLELLGLKLAQQDFEKFVPLLKGFPEQVTYAATLVSEMGPDLAFKKSSFEIANFSIYRANIVIDKFAADENLIRFLRFIASFEFVSVDFISSIGEDIGENLTDYLDTLMSFNVCETLGPTNNYFRVNEIIRDAIIRDRFAIDEKFEKALTKFVEQFANSWDSAEFDVSEYQLAVREALSSGISLPDRMLIPAHFLQTMRQLYDGRSYKEVIELADRILQNTENFDHHTEQDIRYYLCQSLARQLDRRFLDEVQKIEGPEHDFLLGFYYRLQRRFKDALPRYKKAMNHKRTEQRARREIVFVLMTIEDFEGAISLARENFEKYPQNPYLAQAYFNCVIHNVDREYAKREAERVLEALEKMGGDRATEMLENVHARYQFEFGDRKVALAEIDDAIMRRPDIIYPLLTKLDMAMAAEDEEILRATMRKLEARPLSPGHRAALAKGEAILAALSGDPDRAIRMLDKELSQLSDNAKEKLVRKFTRMGAK